MQSMLKKQLQRAFQLGELQVHYQPKFHLATGGLQGVEALLRWHTGSGMWIAPSTFVPVLEETGLIDDVGMWLFQRAAADAAYWRCQGHDVGRVAINVSPMQLRRTGFLEWVLSICSSWGDWGACLELELTESALLPDPQAMVEPMNALAAANVRVALDDFGMGYSSLDLLMQLPASYLKIDRSFVSQMFSNGKAAAVVEAIVRLAHQTGLQVIAEGIETVAQLQQLRAIGCDIGQGHHFSPALGRDALLEYLRGGNASVAGLLPGAPGIAAETMASAAFAARGSDGQGARRPCN
jgi:EAL domain-containing protein (putative c-di-GMP-specific phosphodiesterase class I)